MVSLEQFIFDKFLTNAENQNNIVPGLYRQPIFQNFKDYSYKLWSQYRQVLQLTSKICNEQYLFLLTLI